MAYDDPFALGLLKRFEGYTAKPKWDHKQYSVGYSTRWTPGSPIGTREDHERALRDEAGNVDSYISRNVKAPLTPGQRAALTSFGFNLGEGAIGRLLPDINAGNWDRVGQRMMSFSRAGNNPNALVDRRRQEVEILRGGGDVESNASGGGGMPAQSGYLARALNAAGVIPGVETADAPPSIGGSGQGGPQPLVAPTMRYSKLADALLASAAGAKPKGWGDLLNASGDLALGYTLADKADEQQKAYRGNLAERLLGAGDTDTLAKTLISTGDDDLVKQGVALKVAQAKPEGDRFMSTSRGIWDKVTRKYVPGTEINPDNKPVTLSPGQRLVQPDTGQEVYTAPPKPEDLQTVAPGATLYDPNSRAPLYTAPNKPGDPLEQGKYEQQLRKEYTSLSGEMRTITDSYNRMRTASSQNTGAGDMAIVYGYMKMLDPTSVVREGEYATAENTGGIGEKVYGMYNRILNGQRLTPEQRSQFLSAAGGIAKDKDVRFQKLRSQFDDIARKSGADPARIMLDEGDAVEQASPAARQTSPIAPGGGRPRAVNPTTGEAVEFNEQTGQWEPAQ